MLIQKIVPNAKVKETNEEMENVRENARVYANDLRREVNRLEKSMGINLEEDNDDDLSDRYDEMKKFMKKFITTLAVEFCMLDYDKYFSNKKKKKQKKDLTVKKVLKSPLFLRGHAKRWDSELFKKQYWSLLCVSITENIDGIVAGQILLTNSRMSVEEKKVLYIGKLFTAILNFTYTFFDPKASYREDLFNLYVMLTCKAVKKKEQLEKEWTTVVAKQLKENIGVIFIDDGITKNEMVKFAYLIATNNHKIGTAVICDLDKCAESKDTRDVIDALGMCVTDDWTRNGRPLFIDVYMKCCPVMRYKFNDLNTNMNINYGCKMISMVDFMMDSKQIHHFVNRMIKAPIGRGLFGAFYLD